MSLFASNPECEDKSLQEETVDPFGMNVSSELGQELVDLENREVWRS